MILTDELCDKLCAAAHEKGKEVGIDISFAVCDENGLPRVYRRFGDALVLSITLFFWLPQNNIVGAKSTLLRRLLSLSNLSSCTFPNQTHFTELRCGFRRRHYLIILPQQLRRRGDIVDTGSGRLKWGFL